MKQRSGGSGGGTATEASGLPPTPRLAVLPKNEALDTEAEAAAAVGLYVVRFTFLDALELHPSAPFANPWPLLSAPAVASAVDEAGDGATDVVVVARGIHRGFMLSEERYTLLYNLFRKRFGIELITSPAQYSRAHYYPNAYPFIRDFSPRSTWCEVPVPGAVRPADFAEAVSTVSQWGCSHVMLKDYVKSAKPHFVQVPVDGWKSLGECAAELVGHRGSRFNRGVVFKEFIPTSRPRNEWRLWFVNEGHLLSANFNSEDSLDSPPRVPRDLVERASLAARAMGCPFVSIDFAQAKDGSWFCLEAGDGGVSGPAVDQDLFEFWEGLRRTLLDGHHRPLPDSGGQGPTIASEDSSGRFTVNIHLKVVAAAATYT